MSLERGPLSLVSTIEELLERKSSDSGLESRNYGRRTYSCLCSGHCLTPVVCATLRTTNVWQHNLCRYNFVFVVFENTSTHFGSNM
jgi:hypothetical protein